MKITAIQDRTGRRWHFATLSKLQAGILSKSLRTWPTEREALAAGRKECRQCR